ncbi:MAG: 4-oxalocrotonate tautomerase family protein [Dehalococcoidia bacterium]
MPNVTIEMYPGRTKAQKAELARVITDSMATIAKTDPNAVQVIFREVSRDDWSFGGTLASDG